MGSGAGATSPTARVLWLAGGEGKTLRAVVVYAAAAGLLSLAVPVAVQALVSRVAYVAALQPVVVLTIFVLAALIMEGVLTVLQLAVVEWLQMRVFVRSALLMGRRLAHADVAALDGHDGADLANRFFDVVTVQKSAATLLLDGTALVLQTAMGLILLSFYHSYLAIFALLLSFVVTVVIFVPGPEGVRTAVYESKAKYAVAGWLVNLGALRTAVRHTATRRMATDRMHALVEYWIEKRRGHFRVVVAQVAGLKLTKALASALLLGVGGWLVVEQELTLGQLVAAELVVGAVLEGLAKFGKQIESWYDLAAAADKLGQVIDLPEESGGVEHLPERDTPMEVRLISVQWGHAGQPRWPQGIDWTLQPGARVALVAEHAAGKSSLVDLIAGLRSPLSGQVRADDIDIARLDLESYRNQIAVVRLGEVFAGTVAENLRMGRSDLTDHALREILQRLGADAGGMPVGLGTVLTQGGAPLSVGQRRLLLIARALLSRPRLLVVDGVLDGLDRRSRELALAALTDPQAPWTLLVCTHSDELADQLPERWRLAGGVCERLGSPLTTSKGGV